jgi:peptide/nickel transport system substrate-binding protein
MRLRVLLVLTLMLLLAGACSDVEGGPTSTDAPVSATTTSTTTVAAVSITTLGPQTSTTALPPPNAVVIGLDSAPSTFNPYAPGGDLPAVTAVSQALHAGLTEVDASTLEIVPVLATEVPSVANGGVVVAEDGTTEVTFQIRDEAVWADGVPITGEDVLFTFEVISSIEDAPRLTDRYQLITDIAADGKTVTATFSEPTLQFETMFPVLIPAHQVRGSNVMADWNQTPWVSAGPFVFDTWVPDESLTLVRNERYWRTGPGGETLPYLDRVEFQFVQDLELLLDRVVEGEIDVANIPALGPAVDRVRSVDAIEVMVAEQAIWEHLTFQFGVNNRNDASLNEYLAFRQAVAHGIDHRAILDLGFWESTRPLNAVLDLHGLETDDPWAQYPHDPAKARDLLNGLCVELGRDCDAEPPVLVFSTTVNAEERPAIAEVVAESLAEVGIEVKLDLEDSVVFFGPTLNNGTWDLGLWAWLAQPGGPSALVTLERYDPDGPPAGDPNDTANTSGTNYARWGTSAVSGWPTREISSGSATYIIDLNQGPSTVRDESTARYAALLDEMAATADRDEFATLARQAEQLLADQVVLIPLVARGSVGAVWTDRITGYVHSPFANTWNVETWQRIG